MSKQTNILILPNIRSVINVGAMFRTADAVGIDKIYLVGITPAPVDRFGRERKDFAKASLGAEKTVDWEQIKITELITGLIPGLKRDSFKIIAIEQAENSMDYKEVKPDEKNAFIVGPEVEGLPKEILKACDVIAEIPMRGRLARDWSADYLGKESLNVSTSLGIAIFRILNI